MGVLQTSCEPWLTTFVVLYDLGQAEESREDFLLAGD
jgi:hypothetical protein